MEYLHQTILQNLKQSVYIYGLRNMIIHTGTSGFDHIGGKGVRRHCHYGDYLRIAALQTADGTGGIVTVHNRHLDVHQNSIIVTGI